MKKTVAFYTLGCKLNFSETSTISRQFEDRSYDITGFDQKADVYVINTCSVTQDANKDCRKMVRRALRKNPYAFVAVVGCYAQLEPQEIAAIDGVDLVLGAKEKFDIFDLVPSFEKSDKTIVFRSDVNEAVDFHNSFSANDRTRAFLKVQDGCDYKCSFCTIPFARGKSRSPLISEVVEQAEHLVTEGYQELVVTGVNAGDFGRYNGETFLGLLQALDNISGIERIRISSIEPNLLEKSIIEYVSTSAHIQPHFHIPLQSGSPEILRMMRRRYKRDEYAEKVSLIKRLMPHACIGVDVITGHPGETSEHFQETLDFLDAIDVSYLHVFTYSERPNTKALEFTPVVPKDERKRRTHILRRLSDKKRYHFDNQFEKSEQRVLFESGQDDGFIYGWTENYIRVKVPYESRLENSLESVSLFHYDKDGVYVGELLGELV